MNKQPRSRTCFVCGVQNPMGLNLEFKDDGEREVIAEVVVPSHFNGYPGVVHGGIVAAILDEVSGRAVLLQGYGTENLFVTVKLEVRYRRPTPTDTPLTAVGTLVQDAGPRAKVRGELRLPDGTVTAECEALVARPSPEIMAGWEPERPYWKVYD